MNTQTKKTKPKETSMETVKPSFDTELRGQIERRAHEIWLSSGCSHGNDIAHWLRAENEVLGERQKNPKENL